MPRRRHRAGRKHKKYTRAMMASSGTPQHDHAAGTLYLAVPTMMGDGEQEADQNESGGDACGTLDMYGGAHEDGPMPQETDAAFLGVGGSVASDVTRNTSPEALMGVVALDDIYEGHVAEDGNTDPTGASALAGPGGITERIAATGTSDTSQGGERATHPSFGRTLLAADPLCAPCFTNMHAGDDGGLGDWLSMGAGGVATQGLTPCFPQEPASLNVTREGARQDEQAGARPRDSSGWQHERLRGDQPRFFRSSGSREREVTQAAKEGPYPCLQPHGGESTQHERVGQQRSLRARIVERRLLTLFQQVAARHIAPMLSRRSRLGAVVHAVWLCRVCGGSGVTRVGDGHRGRGRDDCFPSRHKHGSSP